MAAVYKSISKKRKAQPAENEYDEDIEMEMEGRLSDESSDSESDNELDEEEGQSGETATDSKDRSKPLGYMPKTRVLMLTSRGVSHR